MKFVCLNCETYMNFEKVEKPGEDTLGVFFGCPSCNAKFSMVTNPGETQMVSSLGVKLGGRTVAAEPFEMTRGTLKDEATAGAGQMAAYLNEKFKEVSRRLRSRPSQPPRPERSPAAAAPSPRWWLKWDSPQAVSPAMMERRLQSLPGRPMRRRNSIASPHL